jgi:hypothetical protein
METLTQTTVKEIEPQDEAMDAFRRLFRLVAGCEVSPCGKVMTYQLKNMVGANTWLANANSIIIAGKLPLKARIRSVMKGKEVVRVELRIIYQPK